MTGNVYNCSNISKGAPVDSLRPIRTGSKVLSSVFLKDWCTSWIDEAHDFRGVTRGFVGAIHLRHRSTMLSCLTATPIYTSPKVISNSCLQVSGR
jgi:hypothetical protein